jgi:hypothetical protein
VDQLNVVPAMFELSLRQKIPQENIHNGLKQCCQSYGDEFSSEASMYSICTHGASDWERSLNF